MKKLFNIILFLIIILYFLKHIEINNKDIYLVSLSDIMLIKFYTNLAYPE